MKIVLQVPGVFFSFWIYCRANVATLRMLKNLHRNFFTRFIHSEFLGVNHLQKSIFFAFSRFSPGLVQILIGNWPYCKKDNSRLFVLPLIIVTCDCGIQSLTLTGSSQFIKSTKPTRPALRTIVAFLSGFNQDSNFCWFFSI